MDEANVGGGIATKPSEIGTEEHDAAAFKKSAVFHRRALAASEAVLRADPTNTSLKRRLADESIATCYLLAQSGDDLPDATGRCERALELTESLTGLDPAKVEARQDLSSAHFVAGRICQARGDLPDAARHYRQPPAILEPLVAEHPGNVETLFDLERVRRSLRTALPGSGGLAARLKIYAPCEP